MNKVKILFDEDLVSPEEIAAAVKAGFEYTFTRMDCADSLVIGRYSVLPKYKRLEQDLKLIKAQLINSYNAHRYIAEFDYYFDIENLTFKTWFELFTLPENGPFVVKGKTNSKKHEWDKKMFAPTKKDAVSIAVDLKNDSLFDNQDIIVRQFVPLEVVDVGIHNLPMANEWRMFFYKGQLLAKGFYWSSTDKRGVLEETGISVAQAAADILKDAVDFFVVDVAKTQAGNWMVVEVNDGQMSGTAECDIEELYKNLYEAVCKKS